MLELVENFQKRTTTDTIFETLYEEIATLKLLPGSRLSEADIAQRFGVSRQPIRDAFNRLENLELIVIRPQRATEVRGFSLKRITNARFVRLAVELEVIRVACSVWDDNCAAELDANLEIQRKSLEAENATEFHRLDYSFHKLICHLAKLPMAFDTIEDCKKKVDRLCVLSLDGRGELSTLFDDHLQLADAIRRASYEDATDIARRHFARLDETIEDIHQKHVEYFE